MTTPTRPPRAPSHPATPGANDRTSVDAYRPFAGVPATLVDEAVQRIVGSKTFRRSTRHQAFVRHLVRAMLDGRQEELKELVIGIEIFGRDLSTFDPRRDPIVRVEAGRVRDKLARYYANEGVDDAFEVQIPVGGYLPQIAPRRAVRPAARSLGSLAVLPFTPLSAAPEDAVFCEALADQLIDLLSRVAGLRVVGRMSTFKARARAQDPKAIGKLLGVTMVLEGSLQRAGARYRCIAQLYRARDRACIWSQRFESTVGEQTDLFAFQDKIGEAVVAAIAPVTAPQPHIPTWPRATSSAFGSGNPAARDLFERARHLAQRRTIAGYRKAIELLERSIALDPDRAVVHARLGTCRSFLGGLQLDPALATAHEVERHARRALELDPDDGEARALLANIVFRIGLDWVRAEPMYREALRVAPNAALAHINFAGALVFNGRALEAVDHGRIALDLDPLDVGVRANYALVCAYARDFDTAVAEFLSVLEFDETHLFANVMLGMTYLWSGRDWLALDLFERVTSFAPDHPTAHFCKVFVHGYRGEIDRGRQMLADLLARIGDKAHTAFNRAMAESYLDDADAMCASLERVVETREPLFMSLPADPSFDPHRDAPPLVALTARYRLPRLGPSPFAQTPTTRSPASTVATMSGSPLHPPDDRSVDRIKSDQPLRR